VPVLTAARHALADRLDRPTREKIAPRTTARAAVIPWRAGASS